MTRLKFWTFLGDHWFPVLTVAAGYVSAILYGLGKLTPEQTMGAILVVVTTLATTEIIERNKRFEGIEESLDDRGGTVKREDAQRSETKVLKSIEETAGHVIEVLTRGDRGTYTLIDDREAIYRVSSLIVNESTKERLLITGIGEGDVPSPQEWYEAIANALIKKRVEVLRVAAIRREEDIQKILDDYRSIYHQSPSLRVGGVVKRYAAVDVFISDSTEVMFGISTKETSPTVGMDRCIRISDPLVGAAMARWYDKHLWPLAVPIIGKNGIDVAGVERLKEELKKRPTA